MIKLNVHEAKTHLSRHLATLEQGETVLLCKHNIPIAEIHPLPKPRTLSRPIGPLRRIVASNCCLNSSNPYSSAFYSSRRDTTIAVSCLR
jgi:antitoxin (DNA-binding transcriptional repressor) of toxin-antitoxin stability system